MVRHWRYVLVDLLPKHYLFHYNNSQATIQCLFKELT